MRPDFAFLSLARDCAATIPRFLEFLDTIRAAGLGVTALVGENGSRDGTRQLLERAEDRGRVVLVPTSFMAGEPDRLKRMALGREKLKAELETTALRPRFVCVLDIDDVIARPPPVTAFLAAASKLDRPGIFGVSATSRPHYYDLLAFEDADRCFDTLLDELALHRGNIFAYHRFFRSRIYPQQRALTGDREIECASAFNGLCLYRADAYRLGSYLRSGPSLCEHLVFNRHLADLTGAKMLIDPGLILPTPADHSKQGFLPFAWRRLRKFLATASRGTDLAPRTSGASHHA